MGSYFFQHQADECLELAKDAVHREDVEFWEQSARRWAELAKHKVPPEDVLLAGSFHSSDEDLPENLRGS
jgi:hypothetical protein